MSHATLETSAVNDNAETPVNKSPQAKPTDKSQDETTKSPKAKTKESPRAKNKEPSQIKDCSADPDKNQKKTNDIEKKPDGKKAAAEVEVRRTEAPDFSGDEDYDDDPDQDGKY